MLRIQNQLFRGILYLAIITLTVIILISSQGWIIGVLIPYLQYLFGYTTLLVRILFLYIDQYLVWGTFVIITSVFAIAQLLRYIPKRKTPSEQNLANGPVGTWWQHAANRSEGMYFVWQFSQKFAPLLLEVVSNRQGLTKDQGKKLIESGRLEAPDTVVQYLKAAYNKRILDYFSTQKAASEKPIGLNIEPQHILEYIEKDGSG